MENLNNFKGIELGAERMKEIDELIEALAEEKIENSEGITFDDISSDIITFWGLLEEDEDAGYYFESLVCEINKDGEKITLEEMRAYAQKKAEEE